MTHPPNNECCIQTRAYCTYITLLRIYIFKALEKVIDHTKTTGLCIKSRYSKSECMQSSRDIEI